MLASQIEAILFWRAEPTRIGFLVEALGRPEKEVYLGLDELESVLAGRGIKLLRKDDEVMLGTDPSAAATIDRLAKEEFTRDLSRAALETLAIVLYRAPVARSEIDYLRGVNSTFILRQLLSRGLVERLINSSAGRGFLYRPTFELLSLFGVAQIKDLPDYQPLNDKIAQIIQPVEPPVSDQNHHAS